MADETVPLEDLLVRTTARIECEGKSVRSVGTAFFFHVDAGGENVAPVLFTNRHVVQEMDTAAIGLTVRRNKQLSTLLVRVPQLQKHIRYHPAQDIDLAAVTLAEVWGKLVQSEISPEYTHLREGDITTADGLAEFLAIEEALMIGYPSGMWDEVNNYPITHKALTATPVFANYNGKPEFRLSTACYPGSSGSPIFLYAKSGYRDRKGVSHLGASRLAFAGIASATHLHHVSGKVIQAPLLVANRLVAESFIPNHVAVCIKATELFPLIEMIRREAANLVAA